MSALFTGSDTWDGGFYELGIFLPDRSERTVRAVLKALWTYPQVDGCYLDRAREPSDQSRLDPRVSTPPIDDHLLGICTLPNRHRVACLSIVSLIDDSDLSWIYFSLPMGALGTAYPVGAYPFADGTPLDWRVEVDGWLVALAEHVYAAVRFPMGLVGHEVEWEITPGELASKGIPEERWEGYLWPENNALQWYPPNQGAPHVIGRRKE